MIDKLRRRMMGSMAKAKNIATGIAKASITDYSMTVTIKGIGFRPDHVMMVARETSQSVYDYWIYDDKVGYGNGNANYYRGGCTFTPNSDGAQFTNVSTSNQYYPSGDYDFVAWQE